ncbi:hypothetical protein LCGC14_0539810 [marine sediment metagenome]|uniref:KOW domain-containing protein n=1 Tax=marine sediment metagenome TaxID=412755 RepID=A0A0F9RXT3_9ZZZZ
MKFKVDQRVRIARGLFQGSKGTITEVDKRFSSPYRVRIDGKPHISGGSGQERLSARDLVASR